MVTDQGGDPCHMRFGVAVENLAPSSHAGKNPVPEVAFRGMTIGFLYKFEIGRSILVEVAPDSIVPSYVILCNISGERASVPRGE